MLLIVLLVFQGENAGDQLVQKISYTLDTLIDKYEQLQDRMEEQQSKLFMCLSFKCVHKSRLLLSFSIGIGTVATVVNQ